MARMQQTSARIVGAAMTALHKSQPLSAVQLMVQALQLAVQDTRGLLRLQDIDTVIALPSLMSEHQFMIAHAVAQEVSIGAVVGPVCASELCKIPSHSPCCVCHACAPCMATSTCQVGRPPICLLHWPGVCTAVCQHNNTVCCTD